MWANGIASAEAIDNSFKMTLGRRYSDTGPIESAELGGLDILHAFAEFLFPTIDKSDASPDALTELVRVGNHGLKSDKGIYYWSQRDGKMLAARLFQRMDKDAGKD